MFCQRRDQIKIRIEIKIRAAELYGYNGYMAASRFSLRYLMLLVFWWAVSFGLIRQIVYPTTSLGLNHVPEACLFLLPPPIGAALGGSTLRMRLGFFAGVCIAAPFWILIASEWLHSRGMGSLMYIVWVALVVLAAHFAARLAANVTGRASR